MADPAAFAGPTPPTGSSRLHLAAILLAFVLGACGRDVMGPSDAGLPSTREELRVSAPAANGRPSLHACFLSIREPGGTRYRYFTVDLHLGGPRRAGAVAYRYRGFDGGEGPAVVANCMIPADARAAERLTRWLRNGDAPEEVAEQQAALLGCVTEGECALPGLVINACQYGGTYPNCREPFASEIPPCMDGGGCGGWEGGGGYGGGGSGGDPCLECFPPPPPDPCRTPDTILNSIPVQNGLAELWNASNPSGVLFSRVEQGGWIVQMADGSYRLERWAGLNARFCAMDGFVNLPSEGSAVAWVHTHPYAIGEDILNCDMQIADYQGDPSPEDRLQVVSFGRLLGRAAGLPGYLIDANGIRRFGSARSPAHEPRYARCGY